MRASAVACTYVYVCVLMRSAYVYVHTVCMHVASHARMHPYTRGTRCSSLAVAAAARERAHWTGVIKQQDNDGDLRGPTANGLTRRFLRGQHARRRERKVERPRARFINLARVCDTHADATWTRLGSARARLDAGRRDGNAARPGAPARQAGGLFI